MSVTFDRQDREIVKKVFGGLDVKAIAGAMEIAVSTVNSRLTSMCDRARVNRLQLVLWVLENPACLMRDTESLEGLHVPPCECGSPGCLGMIALGLAGDKLKAEG